MTWGPVTLLRRTYLLYQVNIVPILYFGPRFSLFCFFFLLPQFPIPLFSFSCPSPSTTDSIIFFFSCHELRYEQILYKNQK
jgi:hypothetical protein